MRFMFGAPSFLLCCREACEQQVSSLTEELQAEKCRVGDLITEVQ